MRTASKLCLLGLLGLFNSLSGTVFYEIDTTKLLKCTFSIEHQNRIAVENGRIEKAVYTDDAVLVRLEEESGQAFVFALKPSHKEVVISIITDKGDVQDLEVSFENKPSEVVILKEEKKNKKCHFNQEIIEIINAILKGQTPDQYCCTEEGDTIIPYCGVTLNSIASFESCKDTIKLCRLTNISKNILRIFESDLCMPRTKWIYVIRNYLKPHEETIALISYYGDDDGF